MGINGKSVESNAKGKNTEREFFTLSPVIKYYNCQVWTYCCQLSNLFKILIIDKVFIEASKPDSTISLKATHVIKKFSVVSLLL